MPSFPQPFDSTYFDSPYFNPDEAANVAADPSTPGQFDFGELALQPEVLSNATVGLPYTANITLTGGIEPYDSLSVIDGIGNITAANLTFTVDTGNFAQATLSGLVDSAQTVTFTVQGTDTFGSVSYSTSQQYNLVVAVPNITVAPSSLSALMVGNYFEQTFTAANGVGTVTFSNVGNLPQGLVLDSGTGNLSGTVSSNVTPVDFTIVATDQYNSTGNTAYSVTVNQPTITVDPATIGNGSVGTAYSEQITATGGIAPYVYSVTGGVLPANVVLNSTTGNITGVPTISGVYEFTISAYDQYRSSGNRTYSSDISLPVVTVDPASIGNGTVGIAYSEQITAAGGIAPYVYSVTGGVLPANITLNASTGNLSGVPTVNGTYEFTVSAFDQYQTTGNRAYVTDIALPIITLTPTTLANATTGRFYQTILTANGGTPPYTYEVTANVLPASLSLTSGGVIEGIVNQPGTTAFAITAADAYNTSTTVNYTLTTEPINLVITPSTIPNGTCGINYLVQFATSAGIAPYVFSVTAGALPPGLILNPLNGVLSGVCTDDGTYAFTVTATDAYLNTGSGNYTTTFSANLLPTRLPNPIERIPYTEILSAVGGVAPYTYAVVSGSLPAGLQLIDNLITGAADTDGPASFEIAATDSVGTVIPRSYAIIVLPQPPIAIAPADNLLPKARLNAAYTVLFEASGGNEPYTYSVSSGAVPAGLTLNSSTGILAGTVTAAGLFEFEITATDSAGFSFSKPYVLPVLTYPTIPSSAIRVYVGGKLQTTGYTVTSTAPATVAFDTAPPEGVSVTIAVLQGYSWYRTGLLTASDGVALQEQTTPDAIFLQGK